MAWTQTGNITGPPGNPAANLITSVAGRTGDITLASADLTDATATGKAVLASTSQAAARTAIGAGTSNLALGFTGGFALDASTNINSIADARVAAAAGVSIASLVGGKIPTTQIPAVALTNVQAANSEAAQLALTTQEGDLVVRSDTSTTYVRNAGTTGTITDFTLLDTPTDAVTSVAGRIGTVVLAAGDVGLGNVNNTTDLAKPISTATQAALNSKVLASTTVNGHALYGNVTLVASDVGLGSVNNTSDEAKPISTATATALAAKASSSTTINTYPLTGNVTLAASDVGLGNVNNTTDLAKPISSATQTALNTLVPRSTTVNSKPLSTNIVLSASDVGLGAVANTAQVDLTTTQTIGGQKTFVNAPVVPAGSFAEAAVVGLQTDLGAKANTTDALTNLISRLGATGALAVMYPYDTTNSIWPTVDPAISANASVGKIFIGATAASPPPATAGPRLWARPTGS